MTLPTVAIIKPEHGFVGGFEIVVDHVATGLRHRGHRVNLVTEDVRTVADEVFGLPVPRRVWARADHYLRYLSLVERFRALSLDSYDVVVSTQPPSFAVSHRRHVSLFYHHQRTYYDLAERYVEAGFAEREQHRLESAWVRQVDDRALQSVSEFLVGSDVVARRLREFNGIVERVSPFRAPPSFSPNVATPVPRRGPALCVSRHEFPKRTELFVQALHLLPGIKGIAAGAGSRLSWVRHLNQRFAAMPRPALAALPSQDVWLNVGATQTAQPPTAGGVTVVGHVPAPELERLYHECLCVVAPAYDEDYGLTALESMAHGRPVVVCADGGGLAELVEDGRTGLVVRPNASDIAAAVDRLAQDPDLASAMGAAGRRVAAGLTWQTAVGQAQAAIDRVTGLA